MKENVNMKGQMVRRSWSVEGLHVREAASGDSRIVSGYAILFNTPSVVLWSDDDSEGREEIAPEAVTREMLDGQDIKLTMFHDRQLILGRSRNGHGTLSYEIDEKGVKFECEVARTADGDKALELVRRGDISGCSFAFSTCYYDSDFVQRTSTYADGKTTITYRVKVITGIYDFTLAADPAYPDTSVEARELVNNLREKSAEDDSGPSSDDDVKDRELRERVARQVREMRGKASEKFFL